jgi:hypothetical protein
VQGVDKYRWFKGLMPVRAVLGAYHTRFFLLAWWTIALLASGCGAGRGLPPSLDRGGPPLALDSLVAIVNPRVASLRSLRGDGVLIVRTPELGRPRTLGVQLIAERPERARIRARAGALVSVFDLVTDADTLRLYLPRDRAVLVEPVRGGGALPILASRELVPALLQEKLDPALVPADSGFVTTSGGYTILQVELDGDGGTVHKSLFFDAEQLKLVRQTISRVDGIHRQTAVIHYLRHRWTGSHWFPTTVRLELPERGEGLELRFDRFTPNAIIDPQLFVLELPARTRRIEAAELGDDFLGDAPETGDMP